MQLGDNAIIPIYSQSSQSGQQRIFRGVVGLACISTAVVEFMV